MDKSVIAYIDILGYTELVSRHQSNLEIIKIIEANLFHAINFRERFLATKAETPERKVNQERLAKHSYRIISDTILVSMPMVGLPLYTFGASEAQNTFFHLFMFLNDISYLYYDLMTKLGIIFRGGIAIDEHYESSSNDSQKMFIFSKALIAAYTCEQRAKKLNIPAIIIHETFIAETLRCFRDGSGGASSFNDKIISNEQCSFLNIYSCIDKDDQTAKSVCEKARDTIMEHLENNKTEISSQERIMPKYRWLAEQHNWQMERVFNFKDLVIRIDGLIP